MSMYLPPHFDESADREGALELIRQRPFAQIISTDDAGFPFATRLPLHLQIDHNAALAQPWGGVTLLGHVARPNPHWRHLQASPRALAVFSGPQAYQTPAVYPDLQRVPTWNYTLLHVQIEAKLLDHADLLGKDKLLKCLIGDHEPAYAQQWIDLGEAFQHKLLGGIVAFELRVVSWQFKVKINQHRAEAHASLLNLYDSGSAEERELASSLRRVLERKAARLAG